MLREFVHPQREVDLLAPGSTHRCRPQNCFNASCSQQGPRHRFRGYMGVEFVREYMLDLLQGCQGLMGWRTMTGVPDCIGRGESLQGCKPCCPISSPAILCAQLHLAPFPESAAAARSRNSHSDSLHWSPTLA